MVFHDISPSFYFKPLPVFPRPGTKLVLMVSSLTLKAPAVLEALERTVKNGCVLKVLLERDPWLGLNEKNHRKTMGKPWENHR